MSAQGGDEAKQMYHSFLDDLRSKYQADKVFDGKVRRSGLRTQPACALTDVLQSSSLAP